MPKTRRPCTRRLEDNFACVPFVPGTSPPVIIRQSRLEGLVLKGSLLQGGHQGLLLGRRQSKGTDPFVPSTSLSVDELAPATPHAVHLLLQTTAVPETMSFRQVTTYSQDTKGRQNSDTPFFWIFFLSAWPLFSSHQIWNEEQCQDTDIDSTFFEPFL